MSNAGKFARSKACAYRGTRTTATSLQGGIEKPTHDGSLPPKLNLSIKIRVEK